MTTDSQIATSAAAPTSARASARVGFGGHAQARAAAAIEFGASPRSAASVLPNRCDVVIVGAGIAGCALARALAQADGEGRRSIVLLDRHVDAHPRFSGEWIHPLGAQVLDDLGLYGELVQAGAVDVDGFAVHAPDGAGVVHLPYAAVPGQRAQGLAVHHKTLVSTLRRAVARHPQVRLVERAVVTALHFAAGADGAPRVGGVVVRFADGREQLLRADLVVGADGKASTVRRLAHLGDERATLGFTAGVSVRSATLPLAQHAHVMLAPGGPILAYPIERGPDGTVTTRVTFDLPRELPAKGSALVDHLVRAYVPAMPEPLASETAAALLAHRGALDVAPTVELPAPQACAPGLVLVGDAAGCSHPITASGMTMGLRDAAVLGEQARRRRNAAPGESWLDDAAVHRYRVAHDRYVPTRQALAAAIYEAFRGETEGARAIRRALFAYWRSGASARATSMALLSCSEQRPHVFLREYLATAGHAVRTSLIPAHAERFPARDRWRQVQGAAALASDKLGLVASVMWAQLRPGWWPRPSALAGQPAAGAAGSAVAAAPASAA